jgi:hypothetical protein
MGQNGAKLRPPEISWLSCFASMIPPLYQKKPVRRLQDSVPWTLEMTLYPTIMDYWIGYVELYFISLVGGILIDFMSCDMCSMKC